MIPQKQDYERNTLPDALYKVYLLPEPRAEKAVDEKVGRGVDDEEHVRDEAKKDDPDGEAAKYRAPADLDLLQEQSSSLCFSGEEGKTPGGWRAREG